MEIATYKAWIAYLQLDLNKKDKQIEKLTNDYDQLVREFEKYQEDHALDYFRLWPPHSVYYSPLNLPSPK